MTGRNAFIDSPQAVEIARKAILGKVSLTSPERVTAERTGSHVVVTFWRSNPPGSLAPDYDGRVTNDGTTGDVLEILGGS